MIKVNAIGDPCPIPVVKTKKAIGQLEGAGEVETLVDNEIAVQNLTKMAKQKGYDVKSEKLEEQKYRVVMCISGEQAGAQQEAADVRNEEIGVQQGEAGTRQNQVAGSLEEAVCAPDLRKNKVVVISSGKMGEGNEELGAVLMKGFLYALSEQEELPATILFYNGGAPLTCEGSAALEDLKSLEAQGVEILTCGTCLNYYGLSEKLQVGGVTNMYVIAEKMMQASLIIKP